MKHKYKILLFLLFCFLVFFMTGCLESTPSGVQKRIERMYGLFLPFSLNKKMIYADEWGYIILKLPASDLKKILNKPVPKFSEWKPYKGILVTGYKKSFVISGRRNDHYMVAWNYSPTKHKCDKLAIFIDTSKKLLIFHNGIISGY